MTQLAVSTQETLVSASTAATGQSASVNLTGTCNQWNAFMVLTSPQSYNGFPNLTFSCSMDNVNWGVVQPSAQYGNWFWFNVPCQYVQVQWSNNNPSGSGTMSIFAVGRSD